MNSRRIHELMRQHFPAFSAAERDWKNVVGSDASSEVLLQEILAEHFGEAEVLVEVHRKLGARLSVREAVPFVCSHIGEGQIQIANREFTSFVVVAQNGVATTWRA
jgi:hypothetical protein